MRPNDVMIIMKHIVGCEMMECTKVSFNDMSNRRYYNEL